MNLLTRKYRLRGWHILGMYVVFSWLTSVVEGIL